MLTAERQSQLMSRVRAQDTKPELAVRRYLHAAGFRFRLHRRDLPGTPDIVLPRHRLVLFIHGCFWHQHHNCSLSKRPKSNLSYWEPKLQRIALRDRRVTEELTSQGWRVDVIWECQTKSPAALAAAVTRVLDHLQISD